MEMHIAGREELDYIIGDSPQPETNDPSYSKWYAENQKSKAGYVLRMKFGLLLLRHSMTDRMKLKSLLLINVPFLFVNQVVLFLYIMVN